jgi:hypothetical protein
MQPLRIVPEAYLGKVLARRIKAFDERRAASHVPLTHFKLFGEHMRTYDKKQPDGSAHRRYASLAGTVHDVSRVTDPGVASLVGASRAPIVRWPGGATERTALLDEPLVAPNVMVMNRPALLARLPPRPPQ